jgi:hypothetical protein
VERVAHLPKGRLARARPVAAHNLRAELLGAETRVLVGLGPAQPVVDVQREDAVAELAEREGEARRVGASRDKAEDVPAGLDQPVPSDVLVDAREKIQGGSLPLPAREASSPATQ